MAKYDAETLLTDLLSIVKSNLNTKLNEIQAEKAALLGDQNFVVPLINDSAWFDTLDEKTANFDPYVYYGLNDNTVIELASARVANLRSSSPSFFTTMGMMRPCIEKCFDTFGRFKKLFVNISVTFPKSRVCKYEQSYRMICVI